jgi:hypothetical protein
VQHLRPALARVGLAGVLLAAHAVGLANYYAGRDFLNPIYAVPTRDVVASLAESVAPTDVVLAEADTGIAFYASRRRGWQAPIWPPDATEAQATIQRQQPKRVWLFEFGRDHSRSPVVTNARLWLEDHHYQVVETQGYAEQDITYRWVKEQLFHRLAYQYKLTLFIYQRQP